MKVEQTKGGEHMRNYVADRIDDASSEQLEERFEAGDDVAAIAEAKAIVTRNQWDAAEVWDRDADQYVGEVRK